MSDNCKPCVDHRLLPTLHLSSATAPRLNNGKIAKSHTNHTNHYNHQSNNLHTRRPENLFHDFTDNNMLSINVGGEIFTTTKSTMKKCTLFAKVLSFELKKENKKQSVSPPDIQYLQTIKRQTFENYCVQHLENKKEEQTEPAYHTAPVATDESSDLLKTDGIYPITSNYYFVDRSPTHFDDILHFLRHYPTTNAREFINRYYAQPQQYKHKLLRLQDEARFFQINPLIHAIQEKLDEEHTNINLDNNKSPKWWDESGPLGGLRRLNGTRIAFATSTDNWVDKHTTFDIPSGYKWATQSEYLEEYHSKKGLLTTYKEWIHFGIGSWDNYRWKYARKVAFIFRDTFKALRFVHSGMEVCDINHVKSLCGLMAESPLMEYDDSRGSIVEGFAGLVLLSQEVYAEKAPSTTSTWTSDEDDEQIQSLKKLKKSKSKNLNANAKAHLPATATQAVRAKNSALPHVASYPNLGPPILANTFAEYTKKQRAALTKNNLEKHTQLEHAKHLQQQPIVTQQIPMHPHQSPPIALHQQPHQHQFLHQSHQYVHHQFNPNGHFHYGQLPIVPAPQLTPRLSVNSLPVPSTNNNLIQQTQKHVHK